EHDGRRGALVLVVAHDGAQVDVGEGVPTDDDERLVQEFLRVLDAARRPQRAVFHDVGDVDAEVRAVAEVVADRGAQVLQRHHDVGHAVLAQQPQDVLHYRLADDWHQWLGNAAGQRPQPRSLATGHHHRLHALCSTLELMRSRRKAADSSGLTTLIHIPVPSSKPAAVLSFGISSRCQWYASLTSALSGALWMK